MDRETFPLLHPRIAYRAIIHSSNQRKIWFALVPARTILTNAAPFLIFDDDDIIKQAYVLGILNSGPVDWFGHLRVALNMNFFILYTLPVPLYDSTNCWQARIAHISASLALTSHGDYEGWQQFGTQVVTESEREILRAELDALATLAFDIPDDLLGQIFTSDNPTRSNLGTVLEWRRHWMEGN